MTEPEDWPHFLNEKSEILIKNSLKIEKQSDQKKNIFNYLTKMEFRNFSLYNKFHKKTDSKGEKKLKEINSINMSDLKVKNKKYIVFPAYITNKKINPKIEDELPPISMEAHHIAKKDV